MPAGLPFRVNRMPFRVNRMPFSTVWMPFSEKPPFPENPP